MGQQKSMLFLISLCIVIMLSACADFTGSASKQPTKLFAPAGKGYIVQKGGNHLLVTAYIDRAEGVGIDAYSVTVGEKTVLQNSKGQSISLAELEVGSQAEVWITGPVRESYPAQADAAKIVLSEDPQSASATGVGRAAAVLAALQSKEMQTPTVANAIKSATLDAEHGFWSLELVRQEHIGQPIAFRIDARTGGIILVPVAQNDAFRLFSPKPGTEIGSTLIVEGEARVFEASFSWSLEDGHNILAEGHEMAAGGAPAWGRFSFTINVPPASQPNVTLLLFVHSAKDGSVQQQLVVPLKVAGDRAR
ncbi:Gmad2 immunoglobulin-like domain-containing protein [Paenibacillus ginsengarvi]|nr:Gmad2 immunoglobulin-like domain-containing protein [Paenibacillus ginsengarvi]